jgi:hypothetical protein
MTLRPQNDMTSIIIRDAQGKTRVVENQPFDYEEILQNKIAEIPDLLPLEAVTDGEVSHITIGYEWLLRTAGRRRSATTGRTATPRLGLGLARITAGLDSGARAHSRAKRPTYAV